ncbi:MAG TPA: hypothetical protein VES38_00560 [Methylotenera sp.]|nr:hypothetical protein [Methylotenera sp.]
MNVKLKFLLHDVKAANQVRKELLLARVDDENIHFLAKPGTDLGQLPLATSMEKTNSLHEGERGILYGAIFGLLGGLYVLKFPSWVTTSPLWYTDSSWYVILAVTTISGAAFVAIGAALLGVNLLNSNLDKFKAKMAHGEVLAIVTVPFYRIKEIRKIISKHYHHGHPIHG